MWKIKLTLLPLPRYRYQVINPNQLWVTLLILIVSGLLTQQACTSTPPPSRILVEEPTRFVRLEVTTRASKRPNGHPWVIQEEELAKILGTFTVNPRANLSRGDKFGYMAVPQLGQSSLAFTQPQRRFLAEYLSDALQQATPLEEALFYMEEPQPQDITLLTSGGVFFHDGQLHILVANFRLPSIGQAEPLKVKANPLTVLAPPEYQLVPGAQGTVRDYSTWEQFLLALPQEFIIKQETPQTHSSSTISQKEQHEEPGLSNSSSLTDKLRELETMKAEGLITEEEYHSIRAKLLNSY
jgi:hypothetical protein